jgi:hypothetical protein
MYWLEHLGEVVSDLPAAERFYTELLVRPCSSRRNGAAGDADSPVRDRHIHRRVKIRCRAVANEDVVPNF